MAAGWGQLAVVLLLVVAITPVLGGYMARLYAGERVFLSRLLGPVERAFLRMARVPLTRDPTTGRLEAAGQDWKQYARSLLLFSLVSWLVLYLVLRTQSLHPNNPGDLHSAPWDLSFNTASSFVTNTNWQFYAGETTLTNVSQMVGLTVQNFVSAGVGIVVVIALIRGIAARGEGTDAKAGAPRPSLGNFWQDLVRTVLYVLLPIALVGAVVLLLQGVVQSLAGPADAKTLVGGAQSVVRGPVASQEAIKMLGTNGGGFFNVNSAMPFENPNGLSNLFEILLVLAIPAALTNTYGRMVGSRRQGWTIFAVMLGLFAVMAVVMTLAEHHGSPVQHALGLHGGNLEGKEQRFGTAGSAVFDTTTTATSTGAVNSAFESLTGLGSLVPMIGLGTSEVVFGGVGSGLYSMLLFVILAVFIGGLMVGRTPELLGKKIEAREIRLATLGALYMPLTVLVTTALGVATSYGKPSIFAKGPQGFSETFYAYLSQGNNNGSAFAGFTGFVQPNGNNDGAFGITFADLVGGGSMLFVRFFPILVVLAIAGSLAAKRPTPASVGTLRTDSPTFAFLLVGVILLVGALTFFPALLLGPVVQALTGHLY